MATGIASEGFASGEGSESAVFVGDVLPPDAAGTRWFVVRTRARQEKALVRTLESAGIVCYLPLIRQVRYYGHRKRATQVPAFSTYVFLHGGMDDTYAAIATGRVAQVIRVADQERLAHELDQLRVAIALDADLVPHQYLERGRPVVVRAGPFKGVQGLVDSSVHDGRLVLQIRSLGRALSLEIDASLLVPVD